MAGGEHILVVEDDPDLNQYVTDFLRSAGYRVTPALDGHTALARVADAPDAIILDVMLPDVSGFEVCQNLKLHRDTNLVPILMLTAMDDAASVKSGLRVGANRYLTKPFEPEELLREL